MQSAKNLLNNELKVFEEYFMSSVKSSVPLLNHVMKYITRHKGKQLRPIFVILSASLMGKPNEKTYRAASLVELLHTATLVHDDVIDESFKRRGVFSIVALWKSKLAVLVGDYLLSKGLLLSLENKDYETLELMSRAVKDMSEGELLQFEKTRKLNITEEEYFKVINGKTASLLSAACSSGLRSVTEEKEWIDKISEIGTNIGLAFQIRDDLFDYAQEDSGKSLGNDLQEKKLTLPIIYAMSQASSSENRKIKRYLSKKKDVKKHRKEIFNFVKEKGGLNYAKQKMQDYIDRSKELLMEFPESEARQEFDKLINYVIERNK